MSLPIYLAYTDSYDDPIPLVGPFEDKAEAMAFLRASVLTDAQDDPEEIVRVQGLSDWDLYLERDEVRLAEPVGVVRCRRS